ncbi:MAG: DEAD/DEAH box helicase, partial [bacterium]|nr:DEAD/DEAH box helicase [bacterium]
MINFNDKNITLDQFQQESIDAIEARRSVLVSAPTGAGKTLIAEYLINKCLTEGQGVIYTAPIKALSNQKFREFERLFPGKVGIITGDVSINSTAPLLIMTTEIFRNKVLELQSSLDDHTWIIFDEIHYIDSVERGTVWEESLIFLPKKMRFLGLSATIPNVDQFADWLLEIHAHPISVIKESTRPVPLHYYFECRGRLYEDRKTLKADIYSEHYRRYFKNGENLPDGFYIEDSTMALIEHLAEHD